MIARRIGEPLPRVLAVLIDLPPDGGASVLTDAGSAAEHVEALRRLRCWFDAGELERLLALAEGAAR